MPGQSKGKMVDSEHSKDLAEHCHFLNAGSDLTGPRVLRGENTPPISFDYVIAGKESCGQFCLFINGRAHGTTFDKTSTSQLHHGGPFKGGCKPIRRTSSGAGPFPIKKRP